MEQKSFEDSILSKKYLAGVSLELECCFLDVNNTLCYWVYVHHIFEVGKIYLLPVFFSEVY